MNTPDADLQRLLKEIAEQNRQLGRLQYQIEQLDLEKQTYRSRRNDFPIVGEFIQVMFAGLAKVGEGIVEVIKLLIKRLKKRNDA